MQYLRKLVDLIVLVIALGFVTILVLSCVK